MTERQEVWSGRVVVGENNRLEAVVYIDGKASVNTSRWFDEKMLGIGDGLRALCSERVE